MDAFTRKLSQYLQRANDLALYSNHTALACAHVLAEMERDSDSALCAIARMCGLESSELKPRLEKLLERQPIAKGEYSGELLMDKDLGRVINIAKKELMHQGEKHISSDVFVVAAAKHDPAIKKLFADAGVKIDQIQKAAAELREGSSNNGEEAANAKGALRKYTIDYTQLAEEGKLDPVIGRDEEIRRAMQILQRRRKNNPVLIGEPGVGKTAIVEGLAQRIVSGEVTAGLGNCRLLALDLAGMVAGASHRGDFEERLKSVLQGIAKERERYVVFIDELHTLVGAGNLAGGFDAANMLKPALARGELRCIGATTLDEYRNHIESDAALERRFQRLVVQEPDEASAISILRGLADRYSLHHGVRISDPAIIAAVQLSARYITDRFLPDKAIDLIDEAAAKLRIEQDSKPEELDRLNRQLARMKLDSFAMAKESDDGSKDRLSQIKAEIEKIEAEIESLEEVWRGEKSIHDAIKANKQKREQSERELAQNIKEQNFENAARIKNDVLQGLDREMEELEASQMGKQPLLPIEVDEGEISRIVARSTGVPVERLVGSERERLLGMDDFLRKRVVNQDEAIAAVCSAVQRSRTGLADPDRPNGAFMFLGATGVGKTELAKAMAVFLFSSKKHLIRIDMSEYMERHSVARLIGAPPGYIGYGEGGQLSEAVRRKPYSVVLFDEIEKAHPEVINLLLQVLEDGRLTDGQGRMVDFRNTIVVMTSNVGSALLSDSEEDNNKEQALASVHRHFPPEFLNRLDETIVFNSLSDDSIKAIVKMQLGNLADRLAAEQLELEYDEKAINFIAAISFDKAFGARPVRREIERRVATPIAEAMLSGKGGKGAKVFVTAKDGKMHLKFSSTEKN